MQTTVQAPAAPTAPTAPGAPATAVQIGADRTLTVIGSDGKTQTIILPGSGPVVAGSGTAAPPTQPTEDYFAQGAAVGVTMTLMTLGVFALYNRWKRRGMKGNNPEIAGESAARLERVERGMEAIAIEIERISEGQRFVTKMLGETRVPVISSEKPNA